jgi:hypothetical protein
LYVLDTNSHPFTKKFTTFGAGSVTIGSGWTNGTILGQFRGTGVDGGQGVGGAFDNTSILDLLQVIGQGNNIVWRADNQGDDNDNPPVATGTAVYGKFQGNTFAQAFPNPYNLDILQTINSQGQIVYFIDHQGNGLFVSN